MEDKLKYCKRQAEMSTVISARLLEVRLTKFQVY